MAAKAKPGPKGPPRTPEQKLADMAKLSSQYLQGIPQYQIADNIGISLRQLTLDLAELKRSWIKQCVDDPVKARRQEVAKLDYLESEAFAAWERSKNRMEKSVARMINGDKVVNKELVASTTSESGITREDQYGDPRFLRIIIDCSERRAKLLGLDAPARTELTGRDGNPIEVKDVGSGGTSVFVALLAEVQGALDRHRSPDCIEGNGAVVESPGPAVDAAGQQG